MKGVPSYEFQNGVNIVRIYTPEHNNSFFIQFISYCFFAFGALKNAFVKRKSYDIVFATSSRLGTGFLGFLVSKITGRPLFLDIRDIFSDNLSSLPFFKGLIGGLFIIIFKQIETRIISHAKWVNFVSPGFFSYRHINNLREDIHLFTNSIDDIFIKNREKTVTRKINNKPGLPLKIIYAGNIGFGQGLELIVLPLAKHFKEKIIIQLVGDGSSVNFIKNGIIEKKLTNIELIPPVNRESLLDYYNKADVFLLQLNDIPAFKKVLPSKIFDYGSFDKPMLAGVKGEAKKFIAENLPNAFLFNPGDYKSVINELYKIMNCEQTPIDNSSFVERYSRKNIMDSMLHSIIATFYI